jgi:hypothetical protein
MNTLKGFDESYMIQTAGLIGKLIHRYNKQKSLFDCIDCLMKLAKDNNSEELFA